MRRKTPTLLLIATILISAYIVSTCYFDYSYISTVVATIVAALGIFGVCIQLKKEADITEAEFLMNFNFTFLTTEKFVAMERALEAARKANEPLVVTEENRQDLIDYLVYLESFAPLVLNKMVRLDVVDDLFSYRYFIAVNNEGVQKAELIPEGAYYRGCYSLYRVWKKYRKKKGLDIPMDETALDKVEVFEKYAR